MEDLNKLANDQVAEYINEVLTALGQMNQIPGRDVAHNGLMTMPVEKRRELIDDGNKFIHFVDGKWELK